MEKALDDSKFYADAMRTQRGEAYRAGMLEAARILGNHKNAGDYDFGPGLEVAAQSHTRGCGGMK